MDITLTTAAIPVKYVSVHARHVRVRVSVCRVRLGSGMELLALLAVPMGFMEIRLIITVQLVIATV